MNPLREFARAFGHELARQLYQTLIALAVIRAVLRLLKRREEDELARSIGTLAGVVKSSATRPSSSA